MPGLIDTPIDEKNIGLGRLLYELRQDLDIYCLISVNAKEINKRKIANTFFWHVQRLALSSIALNICKIFEGQKRGYELNSIRGILQHLVTLPSIAFDDVQLRNFIWRYHGPSDFESPISALQSTIDGFRDEHKVELDRFKTFRDKRAAHSEYGFASGTLPSCGVMEELFDFGADFYGLISAAFVRDVVPYDFKTGRKAKVSLKRLLQELGLEAIKTEME